MLIQQPCSFFNLCILAPVFRGRQCCRAPEPVKFPTPLRLRLHLPRLPHLWVVLVWGLAVVHRLTTLGAAWSTNEIHRKRTICESLTAGTHEVHGRTQGKFLLIKLFPSPDSWDPPGVSSQEGSASLLCEKNYSSR